MSEGAFAALWLTTLGAMVAVMLWWPGAIGALAIVLWAWVFLEHQRTKDAKKLADQCELQLQVTQQRLVDFRLRWGASSTEPPPPVT